MYLTEYWHDDDDEDEIVILPHDNKQSELQVEDTDQISAIQEKLPAQT